MRKPLTPKEKRSLRKTRKCFAEATLLIRQGEKAMQGTWSRPKLSTLQLGYTIQEIDSILKHGWAIWN